MGGRVGQVLREAGSGRSCGRLTSGRSGGRLSRVRWSADVGQVWPGGRIGSRPFNEAEQRAFYQKDGVIYRVTDEVRKKDFRR